MSDATARTRDRRWLFPLLLLLASAVLVLNPLTAYLAGARRAPVLLYVAYLDVGFGVLAALLVAAATRGQKLWSRLALVLLLVGPLVVELAVQTTQRSYLRLRSAQGQPDALFERDAALGFAPRAAARVPAISAGNFDVHYTTDEHGARASSPTGARTDAPTLWFFGDSFTFGHGVADDATAVAVLGERLAPDWRVANYAVPAWGIDQMALRLEQVAPRLQRGDAVIFSPLSEDWLRGGLDKTFACRLYSRGFADIESTPRFTEAGGWTQLELRDACRHFGLRGDHELPLGRLLKYWFHDRHEASDFDRVIVGNANRLFARARSVAAAAGAEFRLIVLAAPYECLRGFGQFSLAGLTVPHDAMLDQCHPPPDPEWFTRVKFSGGDGHWNETGQRMAADFIEASLRRSGLLSGQRNAPR